MNLLMHIARMMPCPRRVPASLMLLCALLLSVQVPAYATARPALSPPERCSVLRGRELLTVVDGGAARKMLEAEYFEALELSAEQRNAIYAGSRVMGAPEGAPEDALPTLAMLRQSERAVRTAPTGGRQLEPEIPVATDPAAGWTPTSPTPASSASTQP